MKRSTISLTKRAKNDLRNIWQFIAETNEDVANSFIEKLEKKILSLELFPERCAMIRQNRFFSAGFRRLVYKNYCVIFSLKDKQVIILRILHCAQMWWNVSAEQSEVSREKQ